MRRLIICLFIILFVFARTGAQGTNKQVNSIRQPFSSKPLNFYKIDSSTKRLISAGYINYPTNVIDPSFYISHLGFFCKKEIQVQKFTQLPLKFRLGSVAYTDMLEGKFTGSRK